MATKMFGLVFAALCVGLAVSRSSGPPAEASTCLNLMPGASSPHIQQAGDGTYDLTVANLVLSNSPGYFTYTAGMMYTGIISAGSGINIRGFLIQGLDPSGGRIGTFALGTGMRHLSCTSFSIPDAATLVHSTPNTSPTVTFTWTAPTGSDGMVDFRFTIVREQSMYFGPLSAASSGESIPVVAVTLPSSVTFPMRAAEDYRITARTPAGCQPSDCSVFAGVDTNAGNNSFLDFYLEGDAKAWVAVGFSDSPSMFAADVIGCNIANTSTMEALDTWNPKDSRDNNEDMVNNAVLQEGSFIDGRIICTISREIVTTGDEFFDLPLNSSLYMIYGYSDNQAAGKLSIHGLGVRYNPQVSSDRVNPQTGMASFTADRVRPALTRLHGILMWISWPLIALTGMYFAVFMRPALPNGEWFQVHRALMVVSLFVGALGFFFIFVAQYRQPNPGLITFNTGTQIAHFAFGLTVMLIHIVNPLIALCRCHPGGSKRWIFNAIHGYGIGIISISLSLTTVGLGTGIFNTGVSTLGPTFNIFWVFVAYVIIYFVVMTFGYHIFFAFVLPIFYPNNCGGDGGCKPSDKNEQELQEKGGAVDMAGAVDTAGDEEKPRKPPSEDAHIRWILFGVFAVFNVLFAIAMIVLIAI